MKRPRNAAQIKSLEFTPAFDTLTNQRIEAATVPGKPLSDDERKQRAQTPAIFGDGVRAWSGDVIARMPAAVAAAVDPLALSVAESDLAAADLKVKLAKELLEQKRAPVLDAQAAFRVARAALHDAESAATRSAQAVLETKAMAQRAACVPSPTIYVILAAESSRIRFDGRLDGV